MGLHDALLIVVPIGLVIAAVGAWRASATLGPDHRAMTVGTDEGGVTARP